MSDMIHGWWMMGMVWILACKLNEMVGDKVAWYWHELKGHIYGLREMDGYGTIEKEMKKMNYQEMVCDVYVYT